MITHPEKLLFPDDGITKGEVASYYETIAGAMLPHIVRRPLTLERYPRGISEEGFWQKDVSKGFPSWLQRVEVPKKEGVVHYPLIVDERSLLWMANQNTITAHVWVSREPTLFNPDLCLFDLDPAHDDPDVLRRVALAVRDFLGDLGLPSWIKTSGSKGFHIAVPLDGAADSAAVHHFAQQVGTRLVERHPEVLTQEFSKADRGGRIFMDTGRNGFGATYAAPYTIRAKPGAPVSAPCTWKEIEDGAIVPQSFSLRTMRARMEDAGELWSDLLASPQSLTRATATLATG